MLQSLQLVLGIEPEDMETIRDSILKRISSVLSSAVSAGGGALSRMDSKRSTTSTTSDEDTKHLYLLQHHGSTSRKFDDYTYYNVVSHLLRNVPTVLIIENAHFCDELSWKELFLMQTGDQLDMSVLLTMETTRIPQGKYQTDAFDLSAKNSPLNSPASKKSNTRGVKASMNSFSGDYWDAQEGEEAAHSHGHEHKHGSGDDGGSSSDSEIDEALFPAELMIGGDKPRTKSGQSTSSSASSGKRVALLQDAITSPSTSMRTHPTEYWCSILDNETTTVLKMGELSKEEIRMELARTLSADTLTDKLVDLVFNITSGNAYWCKAIAEFIKDRGADALFAAVSDRRSRQNPLKQLVLVHFETHTSEFQIITKHASIIGVEFHEVLLQAIVPKKLRSTLAAALDKLVEKRFLQCVDPQDRTFSFPNQLIQTTLYELTPPR